MCVCVCVCVLLLLLLLLLLLFRYLGNNLYNDTFPWWKDAHKDFTLTVGFQHKTSLLFLSSCLRCGLILINGFRFIEKYLIGKRVQEQKPRDMTSQNYNFVGYSTHVASNFIMRVIKNFTEKLCSLFSQRFSTI